MLSGCALGTCSTIRQRRLTSFLRLDRRGKEVYQGLLHRDNSCIPLQLRQLLPIQRGKGPPLCSTTSALGPPSANSLTHWPIVWASRSNTLFTAAAVQPSASNHTACNRSLYRGVGSRYMCRRTSALFFRHRSSSAPVSVVPNCNPPPRSSGLLRLSQKPLYCPTLCGFHLGLDLAQCITIRSLKRAVRQPGDTIEQEIRGLFSDDRGLIIPTGEVPATAILRTSPGGIWRIF